MTITTTRPEQTTTVSAGVSTLVGAVKDALRAVPTRTPVPILACLRVHAMHGSLVVSGFDYETSITRNVPAEGEIDAFVVPGIALRDALTRLDQKQTVSLSAADDRVTLVQGTRIVTLKTFDLDQYPLIPSGWPHAAFETTGQTLAELSHGLATFAGKDDQLPALTGIRLHLDGDDLHGWVTDRYRAAILHRPVVRRDVEPFEVLVPRLPIVAAVMGKDPVIEVSVREGTVAYASETTVITQRVLDGSFPTLDRLFPSEANTLTTFEPVAFLGAVKFVEAGCERNTALALTVRKDENVVRMESSGEDASHADSVPATVVGDDLDTGFNPAFLADVVKVFGKGHDVLMSSTQGTRPSMFESESIPNLRVLLMPRRLIA